MDTLIALDKALFGLINGEWQNAFFDYILPMWRDKTTWIPLYIILLIFLAQKYGKTTFVFLLLIGITILVSDQISSEVIKKMVERPRPCHGESLEGANLLVHCGSGYSFTSSHAANHFALAMQLFLLFRTIWSKWTLNVLWLWAALVAYAQVYVGVHYPLDILCGALLGILVAKGVYWAAKPLLQRYWIYQ